MPVEIVHAKIVRCESCNRAKLRKAGTRDPLRRGLCHRCYANLNIREEFTPHYQIRQDLNPLARVWSERELSRLMVMYEAGCSDKQIAADVGRTWRSVQKVRQRLGMLVSSARAAGHRRKVQLVQVEDE